MRKLHYAWLFLLPVLLSACSGNSGPIPVSVGNSYGYINKSGKMVIDTLFADACCFYEDLAVAGNHTDHDHVSFGFIDLSGKYVIEAKYSMATSFSEGIAFVANDTSAPMAIDKSGNTLFTLQDAFNVETFHEGLAGYSVITEKGELWGFADKKGKTVIPPKYSRIHYFAGGVCGVMDENRKWGVIDKEGKEVTGYQYDNMSTFDNGMAEVMLNGKWGAIDSKGDVVIELQYDHIDVDGNLFLEASNGKWGWIDRDGKPVIAPLYENAFTFLGASQAPVMKNKKWGYADREGKMVIEPKYDFAFSFVDNIAAVRLDNKYGFIDKSGTEIIPRQYSEVGIDYFIRRMTGNSAHFGVNTRRNAPAVVAYKWLNAFYRMKIKEAMALSTSSTQDLLTQFANVTALMPDSTKQEMQKVRVGIKEYREDGGKPTVFYTTSDEPGKVERLYMVQENGHWLVQFSKTDVTGPQQ